MNRKTRNISAFRRMKPEKSMRSSKVRVFPGDVLCSLRRRLRRRRLHQGDGRRSGNLSLGKRTASARIFPTYEGCRLKQRPASSINTAGSPPERPRAFPGDFFHAMSSTMAGSRVSAVLPLLHRIHDGGAAGEDDQNHTSCYMRPVPPPPVLGHSTRTFPGDFSMSGL